VRVAVCVVVCDSIVAASCTVAVRVAVCVAVFDSIDAGSRTVAVRVAVRCSVLHCDVVWCSVLQYVAVC